MPKIGYADQAAGLCCATDGRAVRVVAVTSRKGGVGKTNVSVYLAVALMNNGKDVILLDADLGLADVGVLLGLNPTYNGTRALEDIIVKAPGGLNIIPAASGIKDMASLSPAEHAGLIKAFSELNNHLDVFIVDTATGISDSVISFTRACQEVIVVVCHEPASITDAYALVKVLSHDYGQTRFRILANMVRNADQGYALFTKLFKVVDRFLSVSLDYLGAVPYDHSLRRALQKQRAVVEAYPDSRAAIAFKKTAAEADHRAMAETASGQIQFFLERLISAAPAGARA